MATAARTAAAGAPGAAARGEGGEVAAAREADAVVVKAAAARVADLVVVKAAAARAEAKEAEDLEAVMAVEEMEVV